MKWIVFWIAVNLVPDPCPNAVDIKYAEMTGLSLRSLSGGATCAVFHAHLESKKMQKVFHNKDSADAHVLFLKSFVNNDQLLFMRSGIDSIRVETIN